MQLYMDMDNRLVVEKAALVNLRKVKRYCLTLIGQEMDG